MSQTRPDRAGPSNNERTSRETAPLPDDTVMQTNTGMEAMRQILDCVNRAITTNYEKECLTKVEVATPQPSQAVLPHSCVSLTRIHCIDRGLARAYPSACSTAAVCRHNFQLNNMVDVSVRVH